MFKHLKRSQHKNQVQPSSTPPSSPHASSPSSAAAKPPIPPPNIKFKNGSEEVNPFSTIQIAEKQVVVLSLDDDDDSSESKFRFELVARFFQAEIPKYDIVKQFLDKLRLQGRVKLYKLNPNHILIKLTHDSDFRRLWLRPIWTVNNDLQMQTSKWSSSDFDYGTTVVRVRIRVPELRNYSVDPNNALPAIASLVGKSVEVDTVSDRYREYSICVKIDLMEPRVNNVRLVYLGQLLELRIHYEDVPKFCNDCTRFGHLIDDCNSHSDYSTLSVT